MNTYIMPKALYYYSDGTGRDSYISVNSGGMTVSKPQGYSTDYGNFIYKIREIYSEEGSTFSQSNNRCQIPLLSLRW